MTERWLTETGQPTVHLLCVLPGAGTTTGRDGAGSHRLNEADVRQLARIFAEPEPSVRRILP